MGAAAGVRVAIAVALMVVAWRAVHIGTVVYADQNRPVTRAPSGLPAVEAASAALRANPADVRALLLLAREFDQAGDTARAARAYASALELAPADRTALHEAAASDLRHGRAAESLPRLEVLATHYLASRPLVFPVLGQMLAVPAHRPLVEARAASNPAWLTAFVAFACASVDPLHFAPLFMRRAAAGHARPEEVRCVTDRLRRDGRWDVAYQAWLNSLPRARLADVGHVYNGGFEHPSTGVGFDWILDEGAAAQAVDFPAARGGKGERALRVVYTGKRLIGPALRQYLAVPPGPYELSGLVRLEGLQSVRGVVWVLRCGGEARGAPIAASERFLGSEGWRGFRMAVVVPAGCPGQVLSLEPAGLEEGTTFVSGTAWFDELRLTRAR